MARAAVAMAEATAIAAEPESDSLTRGTAEGPACTRWCTPCSLQSAAWRIHRISAPPSRRALPRVGGQGRGGVAWALKVVATVKWHASACWAAAFVQLPAVLHRSVCMLSAHHGSQERSASLILVLTEYYRTFSLSPFPDGTHGTGRIPPRTAPHR